MIFVALEEAASKGQLLLIDGGMCRFHKRKDGVTVIREIIVLPMRRKQGIGRRLVNEVIIRAAGVGMGIVRLKCPEKYESNAFWRKMGFTLVETKGGTNLWQTPSS